MLKIADAVFEDIRGIAWFERLGQGISGLPFAAERIAELDQALASIASLAWENVTLEAQNRLTEYLHQHAHGEYQRWNDLAREAKNELVTPLTNEVWLPFAQANDFPQVVVDDIQWNVLGAVMENVYSHVSQIEPFFSSLLEVYRDGHLPCGWRGDWPEGSLLVY